jgi:hypothetical protein
MQNLSLPRALHAWCLACAAIAGPLALPAHADSADEIAQLRGEMVQMRQALEAFDARIRALESGKPASQAAPETSKQPASGYVALQAKWSEVRPGTPKARVEELLGRPERELRINSDLVWYFDYPSMGRGSVFFNNAGLVAAVQPPRVGWSW